MTIAENKFENAQVISDASSSIEPKSIVRSVKLEEWNRRRSVGMSKSRLQAALRGDIKLAKQLNEETGVRLETFR